MNDQMHFLEPKDYLPTVIPIFNQLKTRVQTAIPSAEIEHIGSSAIQNAISKGDLDILVRVMKKDFEKALTTIQNLGFQIKQDTLRTDSLCMLETQGYSINVAIQLIVKGSEFEMFILFRDRLNADPSLVEKYNELKMSSTGLSAREYRTRKSKFIESILTKNQIKNKVPRT